MDTRIAGWIAVESALVCLLAFGGQCETAHAQSVDQDIYQTQIRLVSCPKCGCLPAACQCPPCVPSYPPVHAAPSIPMAPAVPTAEPEDAAATDVVETAPPTSSQPSVLPEPLTSTDESASFDPGQFTSSSAGRFSSGPAYSLASVGGYIDPARVQNQVRFRYDASYDNPSPDRAEFIYPKCGCFGPPAPGPPLPETGVDFQEFSLYAESLLFSDLISGFIELPFRLINPEVNDNTAGVGDLNVGFRAALLTGQNRALTFQFRTYVPTASGRKGLGTDHVSLEPGLLCMRRFRNGTIVEGEIRDWIPIGGTEGFQGNVLRYGIGVSRKCYDNGSLSVLPVVETVAWSVLSGDVFTPDEGLRSAETTIVNMKFGARFNHAPKCCGGATRTLYVGYGKALTDDRWYNHTIRAEYGLRF